MMDASPENQDQASPSSARGRAFKFLLLVALIVGLLTAALAWAGRSALLNWAERPFGGGGSLAITIKPGTALKDLSAQLESGGAIRGARPFVAYALLTGKRGALQAGEYRLTTPITPRQVMEQLQHGSFQHRLTIPEGWTAAQIARALVKQGWIDREEAWLEAVAEPIGEESFGEAISRGAEGFCIPETYFFDPGVDARAIRDRMLRKFAQVWKGLNPASRDARSEKLGTLEVVTLASMIEREARRPEELPAIASVYLNRLKIKMKLQCCATVHYALGEVWDRALTYADLKVDSPFNTYEHGGLPPGPIGNPSREALAAVLRPADTPYLFYVYRGDGTHEFTRTYAEHMAAARRFKKSDPAAELVQERSEKP